MPRQTSKKWMRSADELFLPDKVFAFADLAVSVRAESQVDTIVGAKHLSVLLRAHETIGSWVTNTVQEKRYKGKQAAQQTLGRRQADEERKGNVLYN